MHLYRALDYEVIALGPSVTLTSQHVTMYRIFLLPSLIYQGVILLPPSEASSRSEQEMGS